MASRQQEKEARRQARLEEEARERKAAAVRRRLQLVVGGLLAAGIVAGIVLLVSASGGTGGGGDGDGTARQASENTGVTLPEQQITDVEEAAKAAGCVLTHPADEGQGHETRTFTAADYKTNPPTSGSHFPEWAQDGIYDAGNEPPLGELVHTLEHGRINVQYKPGSSPQLVKQLETFVGENGGYHMVMYQNPTNMEPRVAATAWLHSLTCDTVGPKTWDALRTFRDRYLDQAPEKVA